MQATPPIFAPPPIGQAGFPPVNPVNAAVYDPKNAWQAQYFLPHDDELPPGFLYLLGFDFGFVPYQNGGSTTFPAILPAFGTSHVTNTLPRRFLITHLMSIAAAVTYTEDDPLPIFNYTYLGNIYLQIYHTHGDEQRQWFPQAIPQSAANAHIAAYATPLATGKSPTYLIDKGDRLSVEVANALGAKVAGVNLYQPAAFQIVMQGILLPDEERLGDEYTEAR
jgi:hypothetical protein